MSTEAVKTTIHGSVLEVVLDRPKANAIDAPTSRRLGEVFAGFRDDPQLLPVVDVPYVQVSVSVPRKDKLSVIGKRHARDAARADLKSRLLACGFEFPDANRSVVARRENNVPLFNNG